MAKEERVSKNSEPTEQSVYRGSATVGPTPTAATRVCKDPPGGFAGENASMKRTLVAQNRRIQQLMAKVDTVEKEREAMRQQVKQDPASERSRAREERLREFPIDGLRMAVFEASTRAEQTAEQCKKSAVSAAVREIARDREAFAEGRREALKRIGELEDALEIALRAAGGVHKRLLALGLSCEDLGKTSVHLSVAAQEALPQDKPSLAIAGETIEAIVGVMRAMEGSGVFDILDPLDDEAEEDNDSLEAATARGTETAGGDESNLFPILPESDDDPAEDISAAEAEGVPNIGLARDGSYGGSGEAKQQLRVGGEGCSSESGRDTALAASEGGVSDQGNRVGGTVEEVEAIRKGSLVTETKDRSSTATVRQEKKPRELL